MALSTMEAEIVAISHCSCELIPIMQMVEFLGPAVGLPVAYTSMHVCIHEDNAGALILADILHHNTHHGANIIISKQFGSGSLLKS